MVSFAFPGKSGILFVSLFSSFTTIGRLSFTR
jgi:hypothetical protein